MSLDLENEYELFQILRFSRDTYVERDPGETANDRNDRAIRVATKWYDEHLKLSNPDDVDGIQVVLLTDDKKNREKAQEEGIICCSVRDYVAAMEKHQNLQDKLCLKDFAQEGPRVALFPPHLTPSQIHDGIKEGKLLQGGFQASRENYLEGFANVEGFEKQVCGL